MVDILANNLHYSVQTFKGHFINILPKRLYTRIFNGFPKDVLLWDHKYLLTRPLIQSREDECLRS